MTITREESEASIWQTLREAVRGSTANFTEISIGRAVVLLAVPMVLEMLMESVFAVADVFFVGRLHLTDAISTVGITESLMTLVYAAAMGLSVGAAATVARRIGGMDTRGITTVIKAQVPMAEMLTYEQHLTSATGGRGSYHMEYSHYDEVPAQLQTKIIAAAKAERTGVEVEEA